MRIKNYESEIENLLFDIPDTRESDITLYFYLLKKINIDPDTITFGDALRKMYDDKFPKIETVARLRRLLQEKKPEYRGKNYIQRHNLEKEVIKQIKS